MIMLQLTANTGPEECCLGVRKALARLLEEAHQQGVRTELLEQVASAMEGNLRSVLVALEGAQARTLAAQWSGSLQWINVSPYRPAHKRKNWFIGAEAFEDEATDGQDQALREQDLCFETLRASGPGGQHVNKTDSAVRLTHLPTGLSVKVQTERSQHANKRLARALLSHKLADRASAADRAARQQRWIQHHGVERGNAIRVFKGPGFVEAC
ncbi:peptide chain release factor H [Ideonella paludis]|uniref:Peptide chain release factor H n=1 Tax=Ideonella paludis TaxID=1233411 RepID=A0ABS5DZE9_9BURK|nr:peptide chain release factor H [Ideonella paludis]MBQ0936201.1 peptide chain release factor H [Ideonella paludis]